MPTVFIPLQGPNGTTPKAPSVGAWQSPSYRGVNLVDQQPREGEWLGLRTDGLVVIDCDCREARDAWIAIVGEGNETWVRKTPRGWHFIYSWVPGAPDGPRVAVFPGTDIRAGATSQIVFHAPGYQDLTDPAAMRHFYPPWLDTARSPRAAVASGEAWSEMPEGQGNTTMTSIAGHLRWHGMDLHTIASILGAVNQVTMTEDPMTIDEVAAIAISVCRYPAGERGDAVVLG